MNRIISIVCLLFGIFAFVACTDTPIDGGDTSEIVVSPEQKEYLSQSVDALATEGQSVTFTTEGGNVFSGIKGSRAGRSYHFGSGAFYHCKTDLPGNRVAYFDPGQ